MNTPSVPPVVPPLLRAIKASEPFETAVEKLCADASGATGVTGDTGAGDLFWSPQNQRSKLAIVLEPDVPTSRALEMVPLVMVALGDCLGVLVPPQVAVQFRSPLQIVVNAGVAGHIKAAIAPTANDDEVPKWLVLAVDVGLTRAADAPDPGLQPDITTLDEEGCENLDHIKFIETFARHFLSWLAIWHDDGFSQIARAWKFKAEDESDPDMKKIRAQVVVGKAVK